MCGRFTLTLDPDELRSIAEGWGIKVAQSRPDGLKPRYNIAPTQPVAAVVNDGRVRVEMLTWGLIPSWAKDRQVGQRLINARSETLAEKPAFRSAYRRQRCLILATGYFEWQTSLEGKVKTPYYIYPQKTNPLGKPKLMAFGGLWERWLSKDESEEIKSCTIITRDPGDWPVTLMKANQADQVILLKNIHNRMPVILSPGDFPQWLANQEIQPDLLAPLLAIDPPALAAYPVARLVNSPNNDSPICIQPAL